MTTYFLIPHSHTGEDKRMVPTEKIRRVDSTPAKVKVLAKSYEKTLNGGRLWSPEEAAKIINAGDREALWSVTAVPFSEARGYTDFNRWPCNREEAAPPNFV
jgi:hypothetical protein